MLGRVWPGLGRFAESRVYGVLVDVVDDGVEMVFVSYVAIMVFSHPEGFLGNVEPRLGIAEHGPASAIRLPRLEDFGKIDLGFYERVNVIGHHNVSDEVVFPGGMVMEGWNNGLRYLGML
ncbi:MAG: hypothetical protein AAGB46_13770 [Verrucomicrobiota bacterium]